MAIESGQHHYRCGECSAAFTVKDGEAYDDEPKTRICLVCGGGKGDIAYLGWQGSAPFMRSDTINPVRGLDGKIRDSKADYYQHLKDNKCHVVDYEQKPRAEQYGDYKPTKELKEALQQHLANKPTVRKKRR